MNLTDHPDSLQIRMARIIWLDQWSLFRTVHSWNSAQFGQICDLFPRPVKWKKFYSICLFCKNLGISVERSFCNGWQQRKHTSTNNNYIYKTHSLNKCAKDDATREHLSLLAIPHFLLMKHNTTYLYNLCLLHHTLPESGNKCCHHTAFWKQSLKLHWMLLVCFESCLVVYVSKT